MIQNYTQLLERISRASNKSQDEITRLIEAKRAKLSGLISREGAAQIVASELGINFDKEKIKINEILPGIKKVNIIGKIVKIFPIREYKKDNKEGKVANLILADQTGNIKTVLWDTHHISLFENQELKENDVVEISNASLRNNEIHLTGFSDLKKSQEVIDNVKLEKEFADKKIVEFAIGGSFKSRAIIVQVFEPRFFEVCPVCGSKAIGDIDGSRCEKHGKIMPKKRALISLVLDDGTGNIRAVLFSESIEKLGLKENELEPGIFVAKRKDILGREAFFTGNVRQNKLFNNLEFFVSDIENINLDQLIEVLEK